VKLCNHKKFKNWTGETLRQKRMNEFGKELGWMIANSSPSRVLPVLAIMTCLLLAGCAVGPDFKRPAAPAVGDYTGQPLTTTVTTTNTASGSIQHFAKGGDIAGDWWTLFHSQLLNDLIKLALTNNPDLKAAQAALAVARENVLAQRGVYFPSVSGSFSATRQKQPGTLAPVPSSNAFQYNLFTPQVSVSYSPDVFGLNRRTMESIKAQEEDVRFQMIATYTTLTANVVVTAIQAAAVQAQIDATRQLVDLNSNNTRKATPAGWMSSRRNRSSRKSSPRCRRCSSNRRNCEIYWQSWPDVFQTSRRWKNLSCRVCNCR
jgi:Outer membrane efflux protein